MDHGKIEAEVLKRITPTAQDNEATTRTQNKVVERIMEISSELGLKDISPALVGSVAKDTHLKEVDLDIFIMFPSDTPREELEKYGLKIGYSVLPDAMELYAEHPYLRGQLDGITIDLVPCYNIKDSSAKLSAVDRTPFHTEHVRNNLKAELKADVRLFKQFLKGIGAYGAEIKTQGFSGYLCEILVMEYEGFHRVLEQICTWELPSQTIIIPESVREGFDRASLAKFIEPLIFIDPVDVTRNVAAPVSEERLFLTRLAAGEYLARPSEKFFFPQKPRPFTQTELGKGISGLDGLLIGIEIKTEPMIPDILYSQVRKSLKAAVTLMERYEFSVARSKFYVNEQCEDDGQTSIFFTMLLDRYELPVEQTHRGPPASHPNSNSFLEKWEGADNSIKGPYQVDNRWFVDIRREYTSAMDLIKAKFKDLNHGKQLNTAVQAGKYRVLDEEGLADESFAQELTEFILNKKPWEY